MKYKYSIVVVIVLVIAFSVIQSRERKEEKKMSDNLMSNNIEFNGTIIDIKVSGNHDFGIIILQINQANTKEFNPIIDEKHLFPYAIKDSLAEIYTVISYNLKKGDLVELNSNNKEAIFINENGILFTDNIYITTVERDIKFVKENSVMVK